MSLRTLTRLPPKRMLVFFPADETTSILPTNKTKSKHVEEGETVIVEYEKKDYEAIILKLHGKLTTFMLIHSSIF